MGQNHQKLGPRTRLGLAQQKKSPCRPLIEMHLFITTVCITWQWLPKAEAVLNILY